MGTSGLEDILQEVTSGLDADIGGYQLTRYGHKQEFSGYTVGGYTVVNYVEAEIGADIVLLVISELQADRGYEWILSRLQVPVGQSQIYCTVDGYFFKNRGRHNCSMY